MSEVAKPTFKTGENLSNVWAGNAEAAKEVVAPVVETPVIETPAASAPVIEPPAVNATPNVATPETPVIETPVENVETNISNFTFPDLDIPAGSPEIPSTNNPVTTSWKDAIKAVDKKEILKELGLNDFALELNDYMAAGGNAADYISAKAIDWRQVSDVDVIKNDLKKQFPSFSESEISRLFNKKYNLSEDIDPMEKEDNLLLLKADAHIKREQKIIEQSKYKIPEPVQQTPSKVSAQEQEMAAQQDLQQLVNWYNEQDATKNLMTSKRVTLDLGKNGSFNFNIDKPELITKALVDAKTWQRITSTKQGEPDIAKMQKIALYAMNPEQFEMDIFNYGMSKALPGIVNEARNITPSAKVLPMQGANTTEKEAWKNAKSGTVGGR